MKVCSFLPAATKMIYDMGLQDELQGVTFECPAEALKEKPKLVHCVLENKHCSSDEIDRIFSASKAQRKSLYYVDEELLQGIQPDIIFTQDVCEVCQIDTQCAIAAINKLKKKPLIIPLSPQHLDDVYHTAILIASAFNKEEKAYEYLASLKQRTDRIIDKLRQNNAPLKRISLFEWIEPIYNCGHWIPFQIAQAGGIDTLGNPGGDSIVTAWDKVIKYDPEVMVVAPCGFKTSRTKQEMGLFTNRPGWNEIKAVETRQVFLADSDLFTQPSASTLVDGIELLAGLLHPQLFTIPSRLSDKYFSFYHMGDYAHV